MINVIVGKAISERSIDPLATWIGEGLQSYSHQLTSQSGLDTMSLSTVCSESNAQLALSDFCGRPIYTVADGGSIIYEGIINTVAYARDGWRETVGPWTSIYNRARVDYKTVRYDTNPPIGGDDISTPWYTDDDSIEKFGQMDAILSGGEGQSALALAALTVALRENAWPQVIESIDTRASGAPSLSIECVSIKEILGKHIYTNTLTGSWYTHQKIQTILLAHPWGVFQSDNLYLSETGLLVPQSSQEQETALKQIDDIVALGDENYNRYTLQFMPGRRVVYAPVDNEFYAVINNGEVKNFDNKVIFSYIVPVGKWYIDGTFLTASAVAAPERAAHGDGAIFADRVSYTYPHGVQISSGKDDKLSRIVMRFN